MVTTLDLRGINLFDILPGSYKKVASTKGGEYHGACPFCGGTKRFRVQPNHPSGKGRCACRDCGFNGDVVDFVQKYHTLTYPEALEYLKVDPAQRPATSSQSTIVIVDDSTDIPMHEDSTWQGRAQDFVRYVANVWNGHEPAQRHILKRGISRGAALSSGIGYNPTGIEDPSWPHYDTDKHIYLHEGVVIPYMDFAGHVTGIKIRLPQGGYRHVAGSTGGLYRGHCLTHGCVAIVTETELDAAMLWSQIMQFRPQWADHYIPVALPARKNYHAKIRMRLSIARRVILAFDNDEAGRIATNYWIERLPVATKATIAPGLKDVGDMFSAGYNLIEWLRDTLEDIDAIQEARMTS